MFGRRRSRSGPAPIWIDRSFEGWDAVVEADRLLAAPPAGHQAPWCHSGRNSRQVIFADVWTSKDWRNVPGPFYTAETDTCGGGRFLAPDLVLVNEDWTEFVYRQPTSSAQVVRLLDAAYDDPFGQYGSDGNDRWTLELVRDWWADRDRVAHWIQVTLPVMAEEGNDGEAASLRAYADDIEGPLEVRLRRYAFWLDNGRAAGAGDALPAI